MIKEISDPENLRVCATELKQKKFNPGFDNMDAAAANLWIEINGQQLAKKLRNGTYEAMPAVGFRVAKKNGSYRKLARITAIDTIVQNSILSVISEKCEAQFSSFSFAYRKNRGIAQALNLFCEFGARYPYAVKIDPISCFDNLDHLILEKSVYAILNEKATVNLIMKFVKMPVLTDGEFVRPTRGILQGAPLSALLCNIYFDAFDKFLKSLNIPFIRYADDTVLFANSLDEAENIHSLAVQFITEKLNLQINKNKTVINAPAKIQYLGHRFEINKYGMIALENNHAPRSAYYNWYENKPKNSRGRIDIFSDGILRQKEFSLAFATDNTENEIPIETTNIINIHSDVIFDTNFLKKALKQGISINVFDKNNQLLGHIYPTQALKAPKVTIQQLLIYNDPKERLVLAKAFLLASIHNTRLVIRYYHKQHPKEAYTQALNKLQHIVDAIRTCSNQDNLLLLEARAREAYYCCYDEFIEKSEFRFNQRTRRPPENEFNALISFGNVVLYNLIAVEINKTDLDIRVGFLHATNRRMESLNLDIAEIFKPLIVDRTVLSLINLCVLKPKDFRVDENGACYLSEEGKRTFLRYFYEKLDSVITYKDEKISYYQLIKREIYALVRHFKGTEKYKPFKQVK